MANTPEVNEITPEQIMQLAIKDPRVPKVYGNSCLTIMGAHDVAFMLGVNGVATGMFSISYPLAKTLVTNLTAALADYEKAVGCIKDITSLEKDLKEASKE